MTEAYITKFELSESYIIENETNKVNDKKTHQISMIVHIKMPNLKILFLCFNNIKSIQNIAKMQVPHLQQLSLSYNLIINVKSLRKCNFPNLIRLWLNQNYIQDMSCLSSFLFNKNFRMLAIEYPIEMTAQGNDIRWVMKMPNLAATIIHLSGKERISNSEIENCLKQKYPKGHFGPPR